MATLLEQLTQLHSDLRSLVDRDPEQEVRGMAIPAVDTVLSEARQALPEGSGLRERISELISLEVIESGEPVRAADALVVVGQLLAVLTNEAESSSPTTDEVTTRTTLQQLARSLDRLSPLNYSSGQRSRPILDVAFSIGATRSSEEHQDAYIDSHLRHALRLVMDTSPLTETLRVLARRRGADAPTGWTAGGHNTTHHATLVWDTSPYDDGSWSMAGLVMASRGSPVSMTLPHISAHLGIAVAERAEDDIRPVSLNDLYWLVDAGLRSMIAEEIQDLLPSIGAEHPFGPAVAMGDGRQDLCDLLDCTGLDRLPGSHASLSGVRSAAVPSDIAQPREPDRFVKEFFVRVLIDAGFTGAESRVEALPD